MSVLHSHLDLGFFLKPRAYTVELVHILCKLLRHVTLHHFLGGITRFLQSAGERFSDSGCDLE